MPYRLVLLRGSALLNTLLAKFERPSFIHVYRNEAVAVAAGTSSSAAMESNNAGEGGSQEDLLFELPRYGLEFGLYGDGQIHSKDYRGYGMHRSQLLATGSLARYIGGGTKDEKGGEALYTLPEFRQYLVLERLPGGGTALHAGAQRAEVLVLVPAGVVKGCKDGEGWVQVERSEASGASLKAHCYEVHSRFGHLRASSIAARLQLAALYAATGTLLPEPLSCCTGGQMAMELLRQCWTNRPLDKEELAQLRSVPRMGGHLAPGLALLSYELEASAVQLQHLHAAAAGAVAAADSVMPCLNDDAGTAYLQLLAKGCGVGGGGSGYAGSSGWPVNSRLLLTPGEEMRTVGVRRGVREQPAWLRRGLYKPIWLAEPFPMKGNFVSQMEAKLCALVTSDGRAKGSSGKYRTSKRVRFNQTCGRSGIPAYPLTAYGGAGDAVPAGGSTPPPLDEEMHEELAESWREHHYSLPSLEQLREAPETLQRLVKWKALVRQRREAAESYLLHHLTAVPSDVGVHGTSFRLLRLAGGAPVASPLDLARVALRRDAILGFNPFLSPEAVAGLYDGVLVWLQLCVLEDRLGRLERLAGAGDQYRIALIQELQVRRTWSPSAHPSWLVFEAEGQLQIRPAQFAVAAHLMAHPGAIAQLNMGEGKTRVILPMLVLHWADGSRVVRLNFLSTLLEEAYAHLHTHLSAGLLGRKLFVMPFHRDVELSPGSSRAMLASLHHCQKEGGLLLVAPEHRLSLQLKRLELGAKGDTRATECGLLDEIAALPYLDLLDESDELLHHRLQLIYACGTSTALPNLGERARAVQALLRAASRLAAAATRTEQGAPYQLLSGGTSVLEPPAGASPGAYSGLRLLPCEALTEALPGLRSRLAEELAEHPPYELRWLKTHPLRDRILSCMLDVGEAAEDLLGPGAVGTSDDQLTADQLAVVLALRGLLGSDLLPHCLQKRHRVDYGVNRHPTARKRLAVPFRAAHTPSERSEFAQPDVALLLTNLSYYYDGLSYDEFRGALSTLLGMGLNAQRAFYREWLELSQSEIPQEDYAEMDSVAKVDTSNRKQVDRLFRHLSHNMAVVDFWLNHCVLPSETRQFPQRLAASAWNLADNAAGAVVGFSGTNDNHRLLPLQVRQADVEDPGLRATNGKMLAVILQKTRGFTTLWEEDGGRPVWQELLDTALRLGHDALLDCGALLAGASNREAAEYLLQHLETRSRHRGVTFFDEASRAWVVADTCGRRLPRHSSPIPERDTFVIYDDARCRGADLQLRPAAVGLLTLGPGVCKDKLMQAAGRLRQLGRGQELWITATPDVTAKICQLSGLPLPLTRTVPADAAPRAACEPSALPVLRWVMSNTVQATLKGVLQWAHQGLHFAATKGAPERVLQDELLELEELYGGSKSEQPVVQVVAVRAKQQVQRCSTGSGLAADMEDLMARIVKCSGVYGKGHMVTSGAGTDGDEECERELEQEEEEEEEVERQVPRVKALAERDWQYGTALSATSVTQLDPTSGVMSLRSAVKHLQPSSLHEIDWSPEVFVTANFIKTVAALPSGAALNEYLRPVEALLIYPSVAEGSSSGQILLVSEREADQILTLQWAGAGAARPVVATTQPLLWSLAYARAAFGGEATASASPMLVTCLGSLGASAAGVRVAARRRQQRPSGPQLLVSALVPRSPGARQMVSVQLFNGEASYGTTGQREVLAALMRRRREDAEALVGMRGKGDLLPRSDLERASED